MPSDHTKYTQKLDHSAQQLGITLQAQQLDLLIRFLYFLDKWNQHFNLTAIRDIDTMVTHHVLDSLSMASYIKGQNILDVGTGAGFPGIPLAIYQTDKAFTLLDSNGKKTRFLQQACSEFSLINVKIAQSRMEHFEVAAGFDTIISRATSSLRNIMDNTAHLRASHGQLLIMKGQYPDAELDELPSNCSVSVESLSVPSIDAARHVVIIK